MDNRIPVRLTLVSASPRRRELLSTLGIPFDVQPTHAEELLEGADPQELAVRNARLKVERSSFFEDRSRPLLGADTIVTIDGRMFGKPGDVNSARDMLSALSGREHEVITGICLSGPALQAGERHIIQSASVSRVRFRDLPPRDIDNYLAGREWIDKAGAYAIQGLGGALISHLDGDFDNVVGLPLHLIHDLISTHYSHCRFL